MSTASPANNLATATPGCDASCSERPVLAPVVCPRGRISNHRPDLHGDRQPRVPVSDRQRGLPLVAVERAAAPPGEPALWFRRGLRGRARDFNWHRVIGFWSAVPVAVIVASGATISYQWAANLVHLLAGDAPPYQQSPRPSDPVARDQPSVPPDPAAPLVELQTLVTRASRRDAREWRTITVDLPESVHEPLVVVTVDRGTGRQPSKREDLLFDRTTGELVERGGYPTFSRGFRIRRWLRFAHTGEVYGVLGQTIAGAVSLGVAVMVWTGLAMSWRRFFGLRLSRISGGSKPFTEGYSCDSPPFVVAVCCCTLALSASPGPCPPPPSRGRRRLPTSAVPASGAPVTNGARPTTWAPRRCSRPHA